MGFKPSDFKHVKGARVQGQRPATHGDRIEVFVAGLKLINWMNAGTFGHGHKKSIKDQQKQAVARHLVYEIGTSNFRPPLVVRMTRVRSGRDGSFDEDGLATATKYPQDSVAEWLGIDDRQGTGVQWLRAEEKGPESGLRIEIWRQNANQVLQVGAETQPASPAAD